MVAAPLVKLDDRRLKGHRMGVLRLISRSTRLPEPDTAVVALLSAPASAAPAWDFCEPREQGWSAQLQQPHHAQPGALLAQLLDQLEREGATCALVAVKH